MAESFFATLKIELDHDTMPWATRAQARAAVFEYIERFYNGTRRHSALGYLSPVMFERQWAAEHAATPTALLTPIAGRSSQHASSIEAPGSTRTRGAAISVSPQQGLAAPIPRDAAILDAAAGIPRRLRVPFLITP